MRTTVHVALALALLQGCASRPIHPGAIDKLDSQAYDILLMTQASLDEAKAQIVSGKLPASAKAVVNAAGRAYDVARVAQKAYHEASPGLRSAKATELTEALAKVNVAVAEVQALVRGGGR